MKAYLQNKTIGFYVTVLAAVLSVIALILYRTAENIVPVVFTLAGAAIAVEVLLILVSGVSGNKPVFDFASTICAILMALALVISLSSQVDAIGYVIAGLYTPDKIMQYVYFAGFAAASLLLYIIASFMNLGKH